MSADVWSGVFGSLYYGRASIPHAGKVCCFQTYLNSCVSGFLPGGGGVMSHLGDCPPSLPGAGWKYAYLNTNYATAVFSLGRI